MAFVLPTFGHFDYARRCLESFFGSICVPNAVAVVIDDASADWQEDWLGSFVDHVIVHRFHNNKGVIRSLNKGLDISLELGAEFIALGNSDDAVPPVVEG